MLGSFLRAIVLIVVLVAAAAFLLGWWGAGRPRPITEPGAAVGTSGATTERAREIGADVAERAAVAAGEARQAVAQGGITAKIKAKMALDDTVKALDVNVDTRGDTVTVTGLVDSEAQRTRVLQLAKETDGVRTVIDHVQVRTAEGYA